MKFLTLFGLFVDFVEPIVWLFYRAILSSNLQLKEYGQSKFYGTPESLYVVNEAMQKLEYLDPGLFQKLSNSKFIFTSGLNQNYSYRWPRNYRYNIADWLFDHGVDGVILGIVGDYFQGLSRRDSGFIRSRFTTSKQSILGGLERTIDWLRIQEYNEESIDFVAKYWYKTMGISGFH